ncbi:restriction endonuclease subunit S [Henriciella sp.]|uniref:restriction endonuclease subunit S n=1 Tax=Henriciella sp. TaxID=1968823 RepID=UPI0026361209|nr:restriction endonuclease subunit S [Henriciella sp.]
MNIAAYPKYDEYSDSGVQWVGHFPANWELARLGGLFEERRQKVSDTDFEPLSVTKNGIFPQLATAAKTNDGDNRKLVRAGDFVINSRSDRKGSSGVSPLDGSVSLINIVLEPKRILPEFCHHLLKSYAFVEEYYRVGRGIVADLWTTRYDEMRTILVALPSPKEQRAIAAFLDGKCATIDEAVRIKEAQIRLLAERRQILVQQAVTRGLNPAAPMKDSGIDWIGQIPAHWEVLKLRNMGSFQNGISEAADYFGSGHPFITYGDVFNNEILPENASGLAKSDSRAQALYSVKAGDIFFTRTSEVASEIGIASAATSDIPKATFSGFLIRFRPKVGSIVPEFARFLFRSDYVRVFFAHEVNIVTRASLGQELLKNLPVFAPPPDEQVRIATWLEGKTQDLDGAIDFKKSQITALREYKTSLINAAVTGKIKLV